MRPTFPAVLLACLLTGACGQRGSAPSVKVEHAWVRLPAVPGRPGAGYFTLEGNGGPIRLTGVASPQTKQIELHDSMMQGGMMTMAPIETAAIPSGGQLKFEPGGKHAMIFGIAPGARGGGTIALTFMFDTAPPVTVEAETVAAGGDAPEG